MMNDDRLAARAALAIAGNETTKIDLLQIRMNGPVPGGICEGKLLVYMLTTGLKVCLRTGVEAPRMRQQEPVMPARHSGTAE